METFIRIRGKRFSKKKLILASGPLISRVLETIFFSTFQRLLLMIAFFSSIGKVFFNEIFHLLVETDVRANNGFHKQKIKEYCLHHTQILSPSARMRDSLKRFVFTTQKSFFHRLEYLNTNPRKWFPVVGERLLFTKWLHLNLNNGFHQQKIYSKSKNTRHEMQYENPKIGIQSH